MCLEKTKRDEEGGLQPQPKRQATLSEIIDKKSLYVDDDVRAKDITLTIAEQICVDMEPFDLVNKIGFQRLIKKLCPKYKMVSRFHITEKVIPEMYQRVRAKVLELLKDLPHIVITTDIWTSDSSSQSNDFISLTAHGITATFEYKSYCLEVCHSMDRTQDISTRWDSTLQALRRLLEQRVAVQACLPRITCKAELTTEEWIMMEKVVNILRYFEEATKSISKSTATLSDAIPLINSLRKLLENMRAKSVLELIINLNEDLYSENTSDMVAPTPSTSSEMTASGGLWSVCENIIRESEEDDPLSTLSSNNSLKEEVEKYLRSPNIPRDADPLLFWHNDVLYPHLKKLAQKYFSFQMSSVASERLFSTAAMADLGVGELDNRPEPPAMTRSRNIFFGTKFLTAGLEEIGILLLDRTEKCDSKTNSTKLVQAFTHADDFDIKDETRSGQPVTDKDHAILENVEQDQRISFCDKAEELGVTVCSVPSSRIPVLRSAYVQVCVVPRSVHRAATVKLRAFVPYAHSGLLHHLHAGPASGFRASDTSVFLHT
ncbi:Zinc finger BED domain-containing protein 4 [Eumeta japonica]|uniref:Zinc finger BED domain-containing protein 4 n=1 Tax=Eumeta variegata TaxID=151549 RepID=A0A4C1Z2J0_EUMVA|nr:Zinc finger BED domain-containing protein 4 [Eumeta japonica]